MIDTVIDYASPVNTAHPLNRGLVAWWRVLPGQMGGNVWHDLVGRNHGTLTNGAVFGGTTRSGGDGEIRFDGVNDYVNTSLLTELTHTLSAWFKADTIPATGSFRAIFAQHDGTRYNEWLLTKSSQIEFWHNTDSGGTVNITGLSPGTWYHVVQVREGNSVTNGYKVYLNGALVEQGNTGAWTVPTTGVKIGSEFGSQRFMDGSLDDVRIYNRALSATEIWQLYQDSRSQFPHTLRRAAYGRVKAAAAGGAIVRQMLQHDHFGGGVLV